MGRQKPCHLSSSAPLKPYVVGINLLKQQLCSVSMVSGVNLKTFTVVKQTIWQDFISFWQLLEFLLSLLFVLWVFIRVPPQGQFSVSTWRQRGNLTGLHWKNVNTRNNHIIKTKHKLIHQKILNIKNCPCHFYGLNLINDFVELRKFIVLVMNNFLNTFWVPRGT